MELDHPPRSRPFGILTASGALLLVIAAWLLLHAWGLGKTPFHTKGEPREAVVVADIVQNGRWILPRRNGVELPAKPPLFHWLGALVSRLHGATTEQSVRLPAAILSGAATLLLFSCTVVLCGPVAALVAGLALLTSFEWTRAATSARVDMTLAFGMTLSFFGLLMRRLSTAPVWSVLVYAGMCWGALAKGPVGVALPVLQILLLCAVDRSLAFAREIRLLRGLACVVLVVGVWYGLALAQGGREFFTKQILDENVYRFLGSEPLTGGHRHSVGYLGGMLLLGLLPWSILLPSVAATLWRTRSTLSRRDPRLFAALWTLLVFAFYAQAESKRGVYLLPVYPALCLLIGWWASALVHSGEQSLRWLRVWIVSLGWLLAAILGGVGVLVGVGALGFPLILGLVDLLPQRAARDFAPVVGALAHRSSMVAALLALGSFSAALVALSARARRWTPALLGLFAATAAATVAVRQSVLPEIARAETRQRFVSELRRRPIEAGALQAYRHFDYGFVFYWGRNVLVYDGPLSPQAPPYLVMSESEWGRRENPGRELYERIANLESGRAGNLGHLVVAHRVVAAGEERPSPGGSR